MYMYVRVCISDCDLLPLPVKQFYKTKAKKALKIVFFFSVYVSQTRHFTYKMLKR